MSKLRDREQRQVARGGGAITLMEYMREGQVKKTVEINDTLCKGCGSCMATCPKQGIKVAGFSLQQLEAQVDAALGLI